ncbi:MAG: acyl-CoA thioesterase [Rhizomicrobium sp.]
MAISPKEERRENYPWRVDIPTRWMDGDPYGHVNNVVYYSWFDTAVTKMMYQRGVLGLRDTPAIGLCVESQCSFFAPVEFPETVEARVRIGRVGDKSLRYELGLFLQGREEPAAAGYFVHVFVDRATRRPLPLSPEQKAAIADLVVVI